MFHFWSASCKPHFAVLHAKAFLVESLFATSVRHGFLLRMLHSIAQNTWHAMPSSSPRNKLNTSFMMNSVQAAPTTDANKKSSSKRKLTSKGNSKQTGNASKIDMNSKGMSQNIYPPKKSHLIVAAVPLVVERLLCVSHNVLKQCQVLQMIVNPMTFSLFKKWHFAVCVGGRGNMGENLLSLFKAPIPKEAKNHG